MAEKRKIYRVTDSQGNTEQQYPQTVADNVVYEKTIDGTAVTDVKGALDKVVAGIGVTGVKGNAESTYRKGQVNITAANIGAATPSDITAHNSSGTAHNDIRDDVASAMDRANEAYGLASGKARAQVFNDIEEMVTTLNAIPLIAPDIGDHIYIRTLEVPDLWISAVEPPSSSVPYTYTTDAAFVNELLTNGSVKIGVTVVSALETQKVDLTDYQKKTDNTLNTTNKTVVGAINEVRSSALEAIGNANTNANDIEGIQDDIADIIDGTTPVGKAGQADKLATARTLSIGGDASGSTTFDGSANKTITLTLANSGVPAGTYSVVQVNAKGLVTGGNQLIEFGAAGQTTPSANLAIGGLFFELQS